MNRGRDEIRSLAGGPLSPATADFPLAAQRARMVRTTNGKTTDSVELLTSLPPARLDALAWRKLRLPLPFRRQTILRLGFVNWPCKGRRPPTSALDGRRHLC